MFNNLSIPENIKENIHLINKKNLLRFLLAIAGIDFVILFFAVLDSTFPSNTELLLMMKVNAVTEGILVFLVYYLFMKAPDLYGFMIPFLVVVLKIFYNDLMMYDTSVLLYYMGIFIILTMIQHTRLKMLVIGTLAQVYMLLQIGLGNMNTIDNPYTIFSITSMVFVVSIFWNITRFNTFVIDSMQREELVIQKKEIESLNRLKDLTIDLNHKMISHTNTEEYFEYILEKVVKLTNKAICACVLEVDGDYLNVLASYNYKNEEIGTFKLRTKDSFANKCNAIGINTPIIINNLESLMEEKFPELMKANDGSEIKSTLTTPLIMNGEFYGLFNLDSSENEIFDTSDILMMGYIGEQISIVLENHRLYQKVTELSRNDQLTGFFNRWYLKEIKENYYPLWKRELTEVVFVIFDLDNLKYVNDNFGHDVGDLYIQWFCKSLEDGFRATDIFIRNGGDEFVGVLFSIPEEELIEKLEGIRSLFMSRIFRNDVIEVISSFSYGVEKIDYREDDLENVLRIADQKMYIYKEHNKKAVRNF